MIPAKAEVSIIVNQSISDKFDDVIKSSIEGIDKYEFHLPFFLPRVHRPKFGELTGSEHAEFVGLKHSVVEKLEEWLDYHFPGIITDGKASKIASHAFSYVYYCSPHFSPDSIQFEAMVKATTIPVLLDLFTDNNELYVNRGIDQLDLSEGIEIILETMTETNAFTSFGVMLPDKGNRVLDTLSHLINSITISIFLVFIRQSEMISKTFLSEKLLSNRFSVMIVGAILDVINTTGDLVQQYALSEYSWYFKRSMMTFKAHLLLKRNEISNCSINTYRHFRMMDASIFPAIGLAAVLRQINVSSKVSDNPLFNRFNQVVDEISTAFNDVLGLQKDIQNGEDNAALFIKLKNGMHLKTILDEEIVILKDNIHDYSKLKEMLLETFSDGENLEMYMEICDSALFGILQVFADSEIYGMKKQIVVQI